MRFSSSLPLAALLFSAVPASAQSGDDWTGISVGGQIGYMDAETGGVADLEGDGFTYGLRANYDYDFGQYVVGGGLQYDQTDVDLGAGGTSIDDVFRLGARAGLDAGRNWYYGTVGYARASVDDPASAIGDSDGYYFGLGYEVYLNPNLTAGAELLHHEFEDFDLDDLDADATTLNLTVNFRF